MGPLVTKAIIRFAQQTAAAARTGQPKPSLGRGVAMAIGLFLLTITASVCTHQVSYFSVEKKKILVKGFSSSSSELWPPVFTPALRSSALFINVD